MNAHPLHITLYAVVLIGAIFVSTSFALQLFFANRPTRKANQFLSLALAVWVVRLLGLLLPELGYGAAQNWGWFHIPFLLLPGPLIYFYVLKITRPQYKLSARDMRHFIPAIFGIVACAVAVAGAGSAAAETAVFWWLTPGLNLLGFVSVGVYLYFALQLTERFYRQQKFQGGDRHRYSLRWLRGLLLAFGLLWLLWIPFTAADYFFYNYHLNAQTYFPLYLVLSAMAIWIAAVALLRPEAGTVETPAFLKAPLPAETKQKGAWLKKAMQTGRYYQNPELTLNSLAGQLGLSVHDLSRTINTGLKKSFNDFVNEYRVADVIAKMQDPAYHHLTLLGIAFESGFRSKTTFNRTFKQITGKSPVEYKNNIVNERPSYNLGRNKQVATLLSSVDTIPQWSMGKLNRSYMFNNHFKIAWRNLIRHRSYAAINIIGLAVGITVCIIIFIIIQFQTSFESIHDKNDRIYRVLTEYHHPESGTVTYGKDIPFPLPVGLKTTFPQMEQVAPVFASQNDQLFVLNDNGSTAKVFKEQRGVFYTTPSFFKIFNFPLLAGSYESLKDPDNVLLTKEVAERYFGDWRVATGKTIKLQTGGFMFEHGTDVLKVSGVLATIPANTDLQLKVVVAYGTGFTGNYLVQNTNWDGTVADFGCYVLLPLNTPVDDLNRQLSAYARSVKTSGNADSHVLQPLNAVHYDTQVGNYSNRTISHNLINVLWLIGAFILLIACVNFINLSTAQAVNRAKEVGVRKVLGSSKTQLQLQFITETFLIVAAAVLLAAAGTMLALPYVGRLLELSLSFNIFGNPAIVVFLIAVTVVVTALAGFYPSVVLSGFIPVNALKSKISANTVSGISLRRGLVVCQFIIAQALIIGTLVIVKQMNYFMDQPLGFDKDAVVNVPFRVDSLRIARLDYLKNQLSGINGVQAVSYSSNTPVEDNNDTWSTVKYNHAQKESGFKAITKFADESYVQAYKLPLIAGRNLQPSGYTREFLVNESLVKSLGLKKPEDILNKEIEIWNGQIKCPVVGVLKDFNDRSFKHGVAPLLIATNNTMYTQAGIKLKTKNIAQTMQAVKQVFEKTFPDFVYDYKFLDEKIAAFYKQENQLASLYKIFAAVAIMLSCLGLYGLASFMAVQRVKEVGIRKVLGASAGSIVYLFSKEFIVLISIAFAIAAPIAWYYMHNWLQDYVYRISISWWLFGAGGLAALLIALATISFQAIKAAVANPVKSLRSE